MPFIRASFLSSGTGFSGCGAVEAVLALGVLYFLAGAGAAVAQSAAVPATVPATQAVVRDGDVLAYVNGRPVVKLLFDVMLQTAASKNQDINDRKLRDKFNDDLINREVLVQYGVERGLGQYPDSTFVRNLADAQALFAEQSVIVDAVLKGHASSNPITENAVRKEYERGKALTGGREFKASHILVASEAEASRIFADIKAGGSFETIAFDKSLDAGSSIHGGSLGWAAAAIYVEPFAAALNSLKKGQMTDKPVQTVFGWHVVRVDDVRAARIPPFESIKKDIVLQMQNQSAQKFTADLRAKAYVTPARGEPVPTPAKAGAASTDMNGSFQIRRINPQSAEFAYVYWNKEKGRKETVIIEVAVGDDRDIRKAVVRRIIEIIRDVDPADFIWNSKRLGRNVTLSARPRDAAFLEDFMMQEFFPPPKNETPVMTSPERTVDAPGVGADDETAQASMRAIRAKIVRLIVLPCGEYSAGIAARFSVDLLPNGAILGIKKAESSGYPSYDSAVERAILRAQPLPIPREPELMKRFIHLDLRFTPAVAGKPCPSGQAETVPRPQDTNARSPGAPTLDDLKDLMPR